MKTPMSHAEHCAVAKDFRLSNQYARKVMRSTFGRYAKSHPLSKARSKLELAFTALQDELDVAYHNISSDADFDKHGHVYYGDKIEPTTGGL